MNCKCKIVNCTPHPVCFVSAGTTETFPPSGHVPRVEETARPFAVASGIGYPTVAVERRGNEVSDLPDPENGTWLLVSRMVFDAASNRTDLLVPHDVVRDEDGRIIGCRSFLVRQPEDARKNTDGLATVVAEAATKVLRGIDGFRAAKNSTLRRKTALNDVRQALNDLASAVETELRKGLDL